MPVLGQRVLGPPHVLVGQARGHHGGGVVNGVLFFNLGQAVVVTLVGDGNDEGTVRKSRHLHVPAREGGAAAVSVGLDLALGDGGDGGGDGRGGAVVVVDGDVEVRLVSGIDLLKVVGVPDGLFWQGGPNWKGLVPMRTRVSSIHRCRMNVGFLK